MTIKIHLRNGAAIRMDSVVGGDRVMRRWRNPFVRRVVVKTVNGHEVCCRKFAVMAIELIKA